MTFAKKLEEVTVGELVPKDFVLVSVDSTETVLNTLKLLTEKNILSVPVRDVNTGRFVGLVDMLDLVALVVTMSEAREIAEALSQKQITFSDFTSRELELLSTEQVGQLANAAERNPWCPVSSSTPLRSVFELFGTRANLHRVAVVSDETDNIVGLLTQSALLRFISENLPADSPAAKLRVDALAGEDRAVLSCTPVQTALEAYRMLLDNRVHGMPVVGGDRELIASFSATDLKGSNLDQLFPDLYLRLLDYLIKCTHSFYRENSIAPISCNVEDTLADVVARMIKFKLHRIFLVDEHKRVVRVITLGNIIQSVLNTAEL